MRGLYPTPPRQQGDAIDAVELLDVAQTTASSSSAGMPVMIPSGSLRVFG